MRKNTFDIWVPRHEVSSFDRFLGELFDGCENLCSLPVVSIDDDAGDKLHTDRSRKVLDLVGKFIYFDFFFIEPFFQSLTHMN